MPLPQTVDVVALPGLALGSEGIVHPGAPAGSPVQPGVVTAPGARDVKGAVVVFVRGPPPTASVAVLNAHAFWLLVLAQTSCSLKSSQNGLGVLPDVES